MTDTARDQIIKNELGRAWLSALSLLPPGWDLEINSGRFGMPIFVTASATGPSRGRGRARFFEMAHDQHGNAAIALWALADLLRARP